jgi:hypothetical protein
MKYAVEMGSKINKYWFRRSNINERVREREDNIILLLFFQNKESLK